MLIRRRLAYHLISFLVLLAGFVAWGAAVFLAPQPYKHISAAIDEQSKEVVQMLGEVEAKLKEGVEKPFTVLPKGAAFPYYIYAQDQPWFWSDYHLLPSYNLLKNKSQVQYINMQDGQFLAFQRQIVKEGKPYVVYMLLPLQSSMLESVDNVRYNTKIFSDPDFSLSEIPQEGYEPVFLAGKEEPVFYISLTSAYSKGFGLLREIAAWLLLAGFLGVGLGCWFAAHQYKLSRPKFWYFAICLVVLRLLMLVFDLPHAVYPLKIFNPQHYASSSLNPSLADFLLNILLLLGLLLLFWHRRLYLLNKAELKLNERAGKAVAVLWVLFFMLVHFYLMRLLFLHAQFSLDITQSIELSSLKILAWLLVGLVSAMFFLLTHPALVWLASRSFIRIEIVVALVLLGACMFFLSLESVLNLLLLPSLLLYFLLYRKLSVRTRAYKLDYSLFIYLFGAAIICGFSASLALYSQHKTTLLAEKERMATQILTERDLVGEYLLHEAAVNLQNDSYIINRFLSPLFSKEGIEQKIRRQYLSRYFDKYDTNIRLYGLDGMPIGNQFTESYFSLLDQVVLEGEATKLPGLYRMPGAGAGDYQYKQFVPVAYQNAIIGYVVLDLTLKRYQPRTVYPELFAGQPLSDPLFEGKNYAVYADGKLRLDAGEFDYLHQFPQELLQEQALYQEGVVVKGYHHFALEGDHERVVVVSNPAHPLAFVYANFSFLLLMLLFLITLYLLAYLLYRRLSVRYLNFTTKIQLYLNFAIFLPLLVITISTLSLISNSYRKETESQFFDRAESISRGISDLLHDYKNGYLDKEVLGNNLDRIARYTETDIHLFDTQGMLLATSQPAIYQKNYLAPVINPHAQAQIVEQRHRQTILTETVNKLQYRSAYVAVRSSNTGDLLGIVSVPFFDSGYVLERQLSAIFSNIVSIFATLFLFFLLLFYLFSKELTAPLRYIADRLRLISLTGKNQPLSWPADDEIGMLVKEYNHMLLNLQASKEALSRSEKESAWREMAKQVAHEIKNPLTPMRLSLQHLNRRLQSEIDPAKQEKVNRSFQSILEQIDTLSDIATSFSAFAKMPAPRQERFDVAAVLRQVVSLYSNEQHYHIEALMPDGEWWVEGDEQLMQRTFNNLILNGIQAVPPHEKPFLHISLEQEEGRKVLVKIKDNGMGIPETIRTKVFVPNFSTKNSGSGLGLAIAKRGIEHAGGRIWFESTTEALSEEETTPDTADLAQRGTTFFIELPLVD